MKPLTFRRERLTELREGLGLTQAEMARRLCVSKQAVSQWETGAWTPSVGNLLKIVNQTGAPLMRFFG